MDAIRVALVSGTTPTFLGAVFVSTSIALSLRPAFAPLVLVLSILIVYSRTIINRPRFTHRFFALWSTLSVATVAAYSGSTSSALSTKVISSGLLLIVAAVFSLVALAPVLMYAKSRSYVGSRSALGGILLFPALWTTTWSLFVYISPLGRIGAWTPMTGIEMYSWVMPVFGQVGIDYVTALWAVAVAEYIGEWAMGSGVYEQLRNGADPNVDLLTPIENEAGGINSNENRGQRRGPMPYLLAILFLAIIPSYYSPALPPPTHSPSTTEFTVSCVHPYVKTPGTPPTLDDYLAESRTQASRAKLILWPEGAVSFRSEKERLNAFEIVANISNQQKSWIAIGYEQDYSDGNETVRGKRVRGQNALAIFGPGANPVKYTKRKLVPLVESFSFETSLDPPPKYSVHLPRPNQRPKSEKDTWPRTIPITAAICLDVSSPLALAVPVNSTEEDVGRPALILAPARTWHPEIGKAMFAHASMRATEQGASILWCDGGEGGVSGVGGLAAQGLGPVGGIGQVGTGGSWMQTIGIPYPYDEKHFAPTWYSRWGDLTTIFLAWILLTSGFAVPFAQGAKAIIGTAAHRIKPTANGEDRRVERNEATPLLVDT